MARVAAHLLAVAAPTLCAASNCSWTQVKQPTNGSFCNDHDAGTKIPDGQSPVAFGEHTCLYHGGFFYGTDDGVRYVWCVETCPNGCGSNMPQCEATYIRHCDGKPPTPPPAPPGPNTIGGLVLVPQGPRGAACLDGTAPGYWMRAATGSNASNWVIHAQGGGWCWNEAECAERAKMALGSSKDWGSTTSCYGQCNGILSSDCTDNPDFCTWNHVFVGYCDGSSFSGRVEGLHQGLAYRGRPNLDAVLDSLIEKGLGSAENVIFTGGSAGGLTTYLQVDHVASRLPQVKNVKGLGDAGWFLDAQTWNRQNVSRTEFSYACVLPRVTRGVGLCLS